jgi:hypothetical protein
MGGSRTPYGVLFACRLIPFAGVRRPGALILKGDLQSRTKAGRTDCVSYY